MTGSISAPKVMAAAANNTLDCMFSGLNGTLFGARWNLGPGETRLWNNDEHILAYLLSGNTAIERREGNRVTGARSRVGSVTFAPRNSQTDWLHCGNTQALHLYLPNELLLSYARETLEMDDDPEIEDFFSISDRWLDGLFRMLASEVPSGSLKGGNLETLLLDQIQSLLVQHLFTRYSRKNSGSCSRQDIKRSIGQLRQSVLKKINQLAESKLAEDISLKDLADIACMSNSHFLRAFRNTVGQTPYNYVLTMRIERARGLLIQQPQLAIAEVARQTGFKNLSHFSTTFRRIVAVTPSTYRARLG